MDRLSEKQIESLILRTENAPVSGIESPLLRSAMQELLLARRVVDAATEATNKNLVFMDGKVVGMTLHPDDVDRLYRARLAYDEGLEQ